MIVEFDKENIRNFVKNVKKSKKLCYFSPFCILCLTVISLKKNLLEQNKTRIRQLKVSSVTIAIKSPIYTRNPFTQEKILKF
jgi:hypothetical protein